MVPYWFAAHAIFILTNKRSTWGTYARLVYRSTRSIPLPTHARAVVAEPEISLDRLGLLPARGRTAHLAIAVTIEIQA
jgi:hypothetical protein